MRLDSPDRECRECRRSWRAPALLDRSDAVPEPEPIAQAREVMASLTPEQLEPFDFGPGCVECGGVMRRMGAFFLCGDCGRRT